MIVTKCPKSVRTKEIHKERDWPLKKDAQICTGGGGEGSRGEGLSEDYGDEGRDSH